MFKKLENSIIDVIKEEQAKLGYQEEDIHLYYPLRSLNHFFGTNGGIKEMNQQLEDFSKYTKEKLGEVKISNKEDRFCFFIPKQGVKYVHDTMKKNEFIKELVDLVSRHGSTMEEVKVLFLKNSSHVHMETIENGEFDFLIYFEDKADDHYYYCFKTEGCHIIYHRFLPEDYADFEF